MIEFEGQIRIDGTVNRKAPIYNTGYMTDVQYNESPSFIFTTNLNASGQNSYGQDGYSVTYALVTSTASAVGGYGASAIPCSNFNSTTGILQIGIAFCSLAAYQAAFKGGTDTTPIYYVLKTTAKDAIGQFTTRDVLLAFSNTTNSAPILSRSPSTNPLVISAGATTTITYTAADADSAQKLVFSSNTLPSWATISPSLGTLSLTNNSSITLTLSPPPGTNFAGTLLISVTDNGAFPLGTTDQLDLTVGSGLLPPGPPDTPTASASTATFAEPTTGGAVVSYSALATSTTGSGTLTATSCSTPVSPGSSATCTFSGSLIGYSVVVTATNSAGSASSLASVTPPVLYTSISALSWTQNSTPTSNYALSQTGAPIQSYTISPALSTAGLTFSTLTGLISGTPTAVRSSTPYTITGSTGGANPVLSNGVVVTLTVVAASVSTKIAQTITFPYMGRFPKLIAAPSVPTSNSLPGSAFRLEPLNAYSSSGLPVTYAASCSSYGQVLSSTISGTIYYWLAYIRTTSTSGNTTCTVTASQAGNTTYLAATNVAIKVSGNRGATSNTVNQTYSAAPGMGAISINGGGTTLTLTTGSNLTSLNVPLTHALIHSYTGTYSTTSGITTSEGWTDCSASGLPTGLSLDPFTCQLAGIPTAATASATYTINYRNVFGSTSKTFIMVVNKGPQSIIFPAISNMTTATADQALGATNSVTVPNGGSPITYRTSNSSICTIVSGSMHANGNGSCTVTASAASNSNYNAATDVVQTIQILGAPILTINSGSSNDVSVPVGEYHANYYPLTNSGGAVASWSLKDASGTAISALPNDLIFATSTGVISGSVELSQARTKYTLVATNAAGSSSIDFYLTATKIDQTISFNPLNGMVKTDSPQGLFAVATSGLEVAFSTNDSSICTITGAGKVLPVAAGTCIVTASQSANGGTDPTYYPAASVTRQFVVSDALTPPVISLSSGSATVQVNQPLPYLFSILNSGGAVAVGGYSISPDPATISTSPTTITFDSTWGVFSGGNPSQTGTFIFSITANNSATPGGVGASTATFTLTVVAAQDSIRISPINDMIAGTSGDAAISGSSISGRAITYSASPSSVCSVISGALHSIGYGTCTLSGHINGDSNWSAADASIIINIHAPPTLSVTNSPITLTGGTAFSTSVLVQSYLGDPASKFELFDSTGASGVNYTSTGIDSLSFNPSTGALTGTTTSINQSATVYTLRATNPYGATSTTFSLAIAGLTPPVIAAGTPDVTGYYCTTLPPNANIPASATFTCDLAASFNVTNTGPAANDYILYNLGTTTSATLPAGITFDPTTGSLSGLATAGTYAKTQFDFYAHNFAGNSNKIVVSLTLLNQISITTTNPVSSGPTAGSPLSTPIVSTGGYGTVTWTYANNSPIWLTVDSGGNLIGTVPSNAAGTAYSIDVIATDSGTSGMGGSTSFVRTYSGTVAANNASTDPATQVTNTTATINASSSLGGAVTNAFFCYSTTSPGGAFTPNGTRSNKSCTNVGSLNVSSGTSTPFTAPLTSLTAATIYYFQFFVTIGGTNYSGTLRSFTTYANTFTIAATYTGNGAISPSGTATVNYGSNNSYSITPSSNYQVTDVVVDGVSQGAITTYAFNAVNINHTFAVTFSPDVYVVTFDYSSADSGSPSLTSVNYSYGSSAFSLPTISTLTKANYTFVGWSTSSGAALSDVANPYTPTNSITLYAAWVPDYQILFDKGSGDIGTLNSITGSGSTISLPALSSGSMVKNGYHFINWLSDDALTTYADSATISITAPFVHTLTAIWAPNTYSVTYNPGSSASVTPTSASYIVGGSTLTLPTPTKSGYSFNGWFTSGGGGIQVTSPFTPVADLTLYAQWTQLFHTITYSIGGGSGSLPTQGAVAEGSTFTTALSTGLTKSGYLFNSWNDGSANYAAGATYTVATSDVVLTATWSANTLVVTYNSQGGSSVTVGSTTTGGTIASAPTAPTRTGYIFNGWFVAATTGSAISFPYIHGENTDFTLYAQWTIAPYTVTFTFDLNNGGRVGGGLLNLGPWPESNTTPFSVYGAGDVAGLGPDSTDPLYGWTTNADGSGQFFSQGFVMNPVGNYFSTESSVTLYGKWNLDQLTVTYALGGGSGTLPTQADVLDLGSFTTAFSTGISKSGYTFGGWSDGASLFAAGSIYTMTTTSVVLTANWVPNSQTITYLAGGANGSAPTSPTSVNFGSSFIVPPNTYTYPGYTFLGWSDGVNTYPASDSYPLVGTISGDVTLTAAWSADTLTVTYNSEGGSLIAAGSTSTGGSILTSPGTPTRAGYTFNGWFTAPTGGSALSFPCLHGETIDFTLYAQWSPGSFTFSYSAGANGSLTGSELQSVAIGANGSIVTAVANAGYHFVAWSDSVTNNPRTDLTAAANISVTANFALNPTHTISYSLGGGSGTLPTQSDVAEGATFNTVISTGLSKTGFTFNKWSDGSTLYVAGAPYIMSTSNVLLTATWNAISYTFTYMAGTNGSLAGTATQTVAAGSDGTPVLAIANAGSHFVSWSDSSTANPRTDLAASADITVTATFVLTTTHTVTYSLGGGSGSLPTQSDVAEGANFTLASSSGLTMSGYTFSSWNDGSANYAAGVIYTMSTNNLLFTALWNEHTPPPPPPPAPVQTSTITGISPATGSVIGGYTLTLTGIFLTSITGLNCGGIKLTSGAWIQTGTTIKFTAPAHVEGKVSCQIDNGLTPALAAQTFTYIPVEVVPKPTPTPAPTPTVTSTPTPTSKPTVTPTPTVKPKPLKTTIISKIYFDMGSSVVKGVNLVNLKSLANKLRGLGKTITITITGYAQPTPGSEKTDGKLSADRAAAVAQLLHAAGVNTTIKYAGVGRAKINAPTSRYVEILAVNS